MPLMGHKSNFENIMPARPGPRLGTLHPDGMSLPRPYMWRAMGTLIACKRPVTTATSASTFLESAIETFLLLPAALLNFTEHSLRMHSELSGHRDDVRRPEHSHMPVQQTGDVIKERSRDFAAAPSMWQLTFHLMITHLTQRRPPPLRSGQTGGDRSGESPLAAQPFWPLQHSCAS